MSAPRPSLSVMERIQACADHVLSQSSLRPKVAFILGSGLGGFAQSLKDAQRLSYKTIPGFYATTVPGHAGELVLGYCQKVPVVVLSGRFHAYEGHGQEEVTFPVRVLQQMGVEILFVTNSAGGVNADFNVGDLMVISDHLNMTGHNPLVGENLEAFGPRFPDMSTAYDPALRAELHAAAHDLGLETVREGVYAGMMGPSYETPAEIRMLRVLGADAVGMSTVPEVIIANHGGMKVVGISCISNMAAGMLDAPLSHEDVKIAAQLSGDAFVRLLQRTLGRLRDGDAWSI